MKEIDKIFFGNNGLTSTSANYIANKAKEYIAELEIKFSKIGFVDEKLSFSRRYNKNTNIEELYFIIKSKFPDMTFKLFRISPSSELKELKNNLEQENLYPSGIVQVVS